MWWMNDIRHMTAIIWRLGQRNNVHKQIDETCYTRYTVYTLTIKRQFVAEYWCVWYESLNCACVTSHNTFPDQYQTIVIQWIKRQMNNRDTSSDADTKEIPKTQTIIQSWNSIHTDAYKAIYGEQHRITFSPDRAKERERDNKCQRHSTVPIYKRNRTSRSSFVFWNWCFFFPSFSWIYQSSR